MATVEFHSVFWILFFVLFHHSECLDEVSIGIQYLNYTIYKGAVASGQCCDNTSLYPPYCPLDQCDVAFEPCGERTAGTCDVFPQQETPAFFNSSSETIYKLLGNVNHSSSLYLFKHNYKPAPANFTMKLLEKDEDNLYSQLISSWTFSVNWLDPIFEGINPNWHYYYLKSVQAELAFRVVSQCSKNYFGPICGVYCRPEIQYSCLDDGRRNCTEGWTGLLCDTMIDHCPGHLCQNGGLCINDLHGYTCNCTGIKFFTGTYCEIDTRTTITATLIASTTLKTTTTTPTTPTTIPATTTTKLSTLTTTTTQAAITTTTPAATTPATAYSASNVSSSDDDYILPLAVGLSIGLLFLLISVGAIIMYCMSHKKKNSERKKPAHRKITPSSYDGSTMDTRNNTVSQNSITNDWAWPPPHEVPAPRHTHLHVPGMAKASMDF